VVLKKAIVKKRGMEGGGQKMDGRLMVKI